MDDVALMQILDIRDYVAEDGQSDAVAHTLDLNEVLLEVNVGLRGSAVLVRPDAVEDEHDARTYTAGVDGGVGIDGGRFFLVSRVLHKCWKEIY